MRSPRLLVLTLALAPTTLLAATPKKGAVAGTLTTKAFCEAFENAETDGVKTACGPDAKAREKTERAAHQCRELLNSGVSQKRQVFNGSAAQSCLAAEKAYAADPARPRSLHDGVRGACAFVVSGTVDEGKDCESALDCKDGLTCVNTKGAPLGKCGKRLGPDAACDDEMLGASHFYAVATAMRSICGPGLHCGLKGKEQVCVANKSPGQACEATDDQACGPGMRCVKGRCADETLARAGQACAASSDCAVGLGCVSGACVEPKAADCGAGTSAPPKKAGKAGKTK